MAQKRRPEPEARDGSSSEEEEEESLEENQEQEESESESGEEEDKTPTPVPKKPSAPKKPETTQTSAHHEPSSSDESGSESDSESDPQPNSTRRADPNIKPIASKPMEEPPKATKKPRSKPSSATPALKSSTTVKRRVESENISIPETKKAKRKDRGIEEDTAKKTGEDSKKQLFQRLWSEEDEIAILKGMIEYTAKKGADPVAEMNAFHDFIKKSLHVDVSKTQLSDKVRRLRKKYENNSTKGKKGEDRTFSKPHEQKAYELSKNIWGGEANGVGVDSTKVNGKSRKNQNRNQRASVASPKVDGLASPDKAKEGTKIEVEPNSGVSMSVRFNRSIGKSSLEEEIVKDGLELISGPKKSELEEKWKKLRVEEVELYLKRVDLIREQTKLVLEALKSSGH